MQFDNPIVKPAGAASVTADEATGCNGAIPATPRQKIEIVHSADSGDLASIGGTGSVAARDLLVHLPFKPRRRAVEASQVPRAVLNCILVGSPFRALRTFIVLF